jgi:VanZ family protein
MNVLVRSQLRLQTCFTRPHSCLLRALTFNAGLGSSRRMRSRMLQNLGCVLLLLISILSIVPPTFRPVTVFPHSIEHLGIFLPVGLAFGMRGPTRLLFWIVALNFHVFAVELLQLWVPGRHARVSDFIVDAVALSLGLGIGLVIARMTSHCSRPFDASQGPHNLHSSDDRGLRL